MLGLGVKLNKNVIANNLTLIQQGFRDTTIIPDKYNTGPTIALTPTSGAGTYGEIPFVLGGGGTILAMNLYDSAFQGSNVELTCQGFDFSNEDVLYVSIFNIVAIEAGESLTLKFIDCKFDRFVGPIADMGNVKCEFTNCEIARIECSETLLDKCYIGGTNQDGINPVYNVLATDCYIADLAHYTEDAGILHADGVHIYGINGRDVENVTLNNMRIEAPKLKFSGNPDYYVNSCVSYSLEYSNGSNMDISNMIANGGGYSFYGGAVNGFLINTPNTWDNVNIGATHQFGDFYSPFDSNITLTNISDTEKLYVGSVWKDETVGHVSVSNDTLAGRTLVVVTDKGTETFAIPKSLSYAEVVEDVTQFSDYPFDIDITLAANDPQWIICYDTAVPADKNDHIRFVNYSGQPVYL